MQAYAENEKEQALNSIVEYFDYDLVEVSREELEAFSREEIIKISHNTTSKELSRFKTFSIYQVAVAFIYQELSNSSSQVLFDACINTSKHKESIVSLVHIACEFGNAYISCGEEEEVAYLNKIVTQEIKKAKVGRDDDIALAHTYKTLFNEDASFLAQNHTLKMIEIENKLSAQEAWTKKLLRKEDIFTLMLLFQIYHDDTQLAEYEKIKALCNLPHTDALMSQEEIKYIANDYSEIHNKKYVEIFNHFFITLATHIKNRYFLRIDDKHISTLFEAVSDEVRKIKWYDRVFMKKDNYLLSKNTMQIQKELHSLYQNYVMRDFDTKIFAGDFKVFYSVCVLAEKYDRHFNTVDKISRLTNEDFSGYYQTNGMKIKNFYEKTKNPIEIEAVNRFLFFWMGFNEKILDRNSVKKSSNPSVL